MAGTAPAAVGAGHAAAAVAVGAAAAVVAAAVASLLSRKYLVCLSPPAGSPQGAPTSRIGNTGRRRNAAAGRPEGSLRATRPSRHPALPVLAIHPAWPRARGPCWRLARVAGRPET